MKVRAVVHGLQLDIPDTALIERGLAAIEQVAASMNRRITTAPVCVMDEPAVYVEDRDMAGWLPISQVGPTYGPAEARTVMWEADTELDPEGLPVHGERDGDMVQFTVPEPQATEGGAVRAIHGFHGNTVVEAFKADGSGIGYLAAVPFDNGETQVQVGPGTAYLRIRKQ